MSGNRNWRVVTQRRFRGISLSCLYKRQGYKSSTAAHVLGAHRASRTSRENFRRDHPCWLRKRILDTNLDRWVYRASAPALECVTFASLSPTNANLAMVGLTAE